MELFLFSSAFKEFTRTKRLLPWVVVLALVGGIAMSWRSLSAHATQSEVYADVVSILVFRIVALMSAIFTTAIISQEVELKTISYLLTRPIPRPKLLLARFAASVVVVFGLGVFGLVAASIGVMGSAGLSNPILYRDIMAVGVGSIAYGGLFLLVSLLINRAMIVCLLFAFGWETAVPNMPGEIYYTSVFSYMQAIAQHPSTNSAGGNFLNLLAGSLGVNSLTPSSAYMVMGILSTGCILLAAWWFSNFEYVPREDAE